MKSPAVSINLCCYNSERYLDETLRSIVNQTYKDWELVVINDGSKDRTGEIVQRYVDEGWPIVYRYQQNAGLGTSRNRAMELSRGEFIALIDHDDLWHPRKLEKQMPLFANPDVALVYAGATVVNHERTPLRDYMPRSRMFRGRVLDPLFLGDFLACSTAVMRKSAVLESGPFRPELAITEEYELFLRLAEKSEFDFVDESLMDWRLHATNATWNYGRAREETAMVLREVLERNPDIETRLGKRVVRLRLAGFSCTSQQARMLGHTSALVAEARRRGFGPVSREMARPVAKYMLSLMPVGMLDATLRLLARTRRRAATS